MRWCIGVSKFRFWIRKVVYRNPAPIALVRLNVQWINPTLQSMRSKHWSQVIWHSVSCVTLVSFIIYSCLFILVALAFVNRPTEMPYAFCVFCTLWTGHKRRENSNRLCGRTEEYGWMCSVLHEKNVLRNLLSHLQLNCSLWFMQCMRHSQWNYLAQSRRLRRRRLCRRRRRRQQWNI